MPKYDFNCNFIEITLIGPYRVFFCNLLHIFGTPFLNNTYGELLLNRLIVERICFFKEIQSPVLIRICFMEKLKIKITKIYK